MKVKLPKIKCQKCGHVWIPKKEDVRQCPKCKSVRFDEPKKEKK
jgi:Zn finger protein HypA/HybF involved in hydrogenase expression